ncbi:hypothetical protein AB0A60_19550 [Streptomyces sp. NPDC046275]|uniref:hypothetical protein n=1 Tax=Streptomyces sp. NPDC046275 TaxID=3157201 RepID=UPI0033CB203A
MHSMAPYVLPRRGEHLLPMDIRVGPAGVSYADPAQDKAARDEDGILWAVCGGPFTGAAEYAAELHPERERETMQALRCAGGKEHEADRDDRGMLWLLPLLDHAEDTVWEGVRTVVPPMCGFCADAAKVLCPRLREGHVELRVREAEKVGVRGTLYPREGSAARDSRTRTTPRQEP